MGCKKCKSSSCKGCYAIPIIPVPGPPGLNGSSAVIPFNTGPVTVFTSLISATGVTLGFGTNAPTLAGILAPIYFLAPRNGTITQLNSEFLVTVADVTVGSTITLTVYTSPAGSTTWTSTGITSTITVPIVAFSASIAGTTGTGSVAVTAGTKIAVVAVSTNTFAAAGATIYVGAGVNLV